VKAPIIADAGPLIGLARAGALNLLRDLYQRAVIPNQVFEELRVTEKRAGAEQLRAALKEGWLTPIEVEPSPLLNALQLVLDPGEAAAIVLAEQAPHRFLLIDDRRGRAVARRRGLRVVGCAGVLLAAKRAGLIKTARPHLEALAAAGYRLSPQLCSRVLEMAREE
jgi:predicted nucleic acid-binding protein